MRKLISISILVFLLGSAGKSADTTFTYTYGGLRYEEGKSMKITFDNGFILVGSTGSFGLGNSDVYVVKTDSLGAVEWTRSYGGLHTDVGLSVKQTADSGYVIAGYTNSFGSGGYDVYVVRADHNGDTLWTKTFGGTDWDLGYEVVETFDSGFAIIGETFSFGNGDNDIYLIRIDADGDSLWTRTYGGAEEDYGRSIAQTTDTGFILAGATFTNDIDSGDAYLVRIDSKGDTVWTGIFGGNGMDMANSVIQSADLGFVFLGTSTSYFGGSKDFYLGKTDVLGGMTWYAAFGIVDGDEEGWSVVQVAPNRYAYFGFRGAEGHGSAGFYLAFSNLGGGFINGYSYGYAAGDEFGYSLDVRPSGGLALFGTTSSIGTGLTDMILLTTDSMGFDYLGVPIPINPAYVSYADTTIPQMVSVSNFKQLESEVTVFPNPAGQAISIKLGAHAKSENTRVSITDISGKIVRQYEMGGSKTLDIHNLGLGNGIYIYRLELNAGQEQLTETLNGKLIISN